MRWALVVGVAVFSAGCDRTHLSAGYGRATRAAFHAQVLDEQAGGIQKPDPGLDPEEAAEVAATYRRSISSSKEEGSAVPARVLSLDPKADRAEVR